ncbi:hypothetical protein EMIHUDRAFT_221151 [Emiliania huxleyi CCMP1516]|uniref:RAP domain-containing protein n=2 Tax=Emiliania huxleyi TaxID=2903 RepID=A0A0D3HZD2_EMIH1|nr:hypothetical protein EMIHUDRAFT_221151 [Emiliania huxleyi CCMP1516]EOD04367.1 hypothetical protein EMIHUDRAFT_221151 [Emiliania huxleyi CCMP1516]|eukprot:XP_005756796.1 hypothetical protein EMIHUDRAFT_221151 [Emiliania huxleyi CCMP1516]
MRGSGFKRPRDESPGQNSWRRGESRWLCNEPPSSGRSAAGGQLNARQLNGHISHASNADELLSLCAANSTSLNNIHAANLWNKLGKQRIERRHEEQLERLVKRTLELIPACEARNLANIAHGVANDSLARNPSRWSIEARSQLHQWQLWLFLERGAEEQQHLLSDSQRLLFREAMQMTVARPSGLQRSVSDALSAVRSGFEEEYLEPRTGYSLDLALPSSHIAIEVDGPSHFLLPDSQGVRAPNGPTKLKRRLLAAAGWRVISVPFYEWDGLNTADERQAYLERAVGSLGPDYEADSCGSPSGSPSPEEGGNCEIAAGASSVELSLEAQVRREVARYALDEGRLRVLVEEQGASFSATVAGVVVDKLCGFIAAAKGMSGTAHYALHATAAVSAEEARANLKTLEKNLKKQVQRRRWS